MAFVWSIVLIVLSNVFYQMCAKAVPDTMDPLASLMVTYLVGATVSVALYFLLNRDADFLCAYAQLNWAPVVLGVVIVGLEFGFIYAYKAGWPVSNVTVVQSAFLASALIFVGMLLYREQITWNKAVSAAICLVGLAFINK